MNQASYHSLLESLRKKWLAKGILHGHGASEAEIEEFQERHQVVLPPDVRAYFALLNGTTIGAYGMEDEDLLGFWHLDQVRTFAEQGVVDAPDASKSFVFADHSIWVYAFALRLSKNPAAPTSVVVDIGSPPTHVADSFAEFIERYLSGDQNLIYPDPPPRTGTPAI